MIKKLIILIILVVIIGVGFWWWQFNINKKNNTLKIYRNEEFGFEFSYPADWKISDKLMDIFKQTYNDSIEGRFDQFKQIQVSLIKKESELGYLNDLKNEDYPMLNINGICQN